MAKKKEMKAKRRTIKAHYAWINGKKKLIKAYKRTCNNQHTK